MIGNKKKTAIVALIVTSGIVALGVAGILVWWFVLRKKFSSPTFVSMKSPTKNCPVQTFELKNNPWPRWVGDGSPQRILVWDGKKSLLCNNELDTSTGWYSSFKTDDPNLCYHFEKDIRNKDGKLDLSKCVAGPELKRPVKMQNKN